MEMDNLVSKLTLRFHICHMTSEESMLQLKDPSLRLLCHRSMCPICIKLGHYLTCGMDYTVDKAKGLEEKFRIVLELPENISDKADLLEDCGYDFFESFLNNKNQKEDIDNCILAYESVLHITPQSHLDMSN